MSYIDVICATAVTNGNVEIAIWAKCNVSGVVVKLWLVNLPHGFLGSQIRYIRIVFRDGKFG